MNDCAIRKSATRPSRVVVSVHGEHAHGLRRRILHLLFCPSTMLSDVMSFADAAAAACGFSVDMVTAVAEVLG